MAKMGYESKIQKYWRPAMAWSYLVVCVWDFLIAPIFFAMYTHHIGQPLLMWKPLTLTEGGMYHMSMGAIVGVAAWTRGKENIAKLETPPQTLQEDNRPG